MAIALALSVSVSIAAETSGTVSSIPRVKRLTVSTSRGCTGEYRGASSTSSNVRAISERIRDAGGSVPFELGAGPGLGAGARRAGRALRVRGAMVNLTARGSPEQRSFVRSPARGIPSHVDVQERPVHASGAVHARAANELRVRRLDAID